MQTREIRVFISSTFNDMHPERDWLVKRTFPYLRQMADERGVALTEVDLRWGITDEEAKEGKTLAICLDEIVNSRPFFIGLLGSRYGWTPTRAELGSEALPERYGWIADDLDSGLSITEIEMQYGVLRNPNPIYASFYIRQDDDDDNPRQTRLKDTIRSQERYPVGNYSSPEELGKMVEERFRQILDELYPADDYRAEDAINARHLIWAEASSRTYLPDKRTLSVVDEMLYGESGPSRLLVNGLSGSGKSALMSFVANREAQNDDFHVIAYFGGCGDSVSASDLAARISSESLSVSEEKRILVIVDDAATVTDDSGNPDTSWTAAVGDNALLIVSAATGQGVVEILRHKTDAQLTVVPLLISQRRQLVENYFRAYGKRLTEHDVNLISRPSTVTENTLAFMTMLEEIRRFGSFDRLPQFLDNIAAFADVGSFYNFLLDEKERFYDSERHPRMVQTILSLLVVSADGLAEPELVAISGIPQMYISQFVLGNTYLIKRNGGVLRLSHSWISDVVAERYLGDESTVAELRWRIVGYFEDDELGQQSPRRYIEVPYQYWKTGSHVCLYGFIGQYDYLKKCVSDKRHFFLRYWVSLLGSAPELYHVDVYFDTMLESLSSMSDEIFDPLCETLTFMYSNTLLRFGYLLLSNLKQYEAVESLCSRALIWLHSKDRNAMRCQWLELLAITYSRQGRYADALNTFAEVLDNAESDKIDTIHTLLSNIAEVYLTIAERTANKEYVGHAVDIQRAILDYRLDSFGKYDTEVAVAMSNLASSLYVIGQQDEADRLMAESTEIYTAVRGGDDVDVAINYHNQALVLLTRGQYEQALKLERHAKDIFVRLYGSDSPHVGESCTVIEEALTMLRRHDEAVNEIMEHRDYILRNFSGRQLNSELMDLALRSFKTSKPELMIGILDEVNLDSTDSISRALAQNLRGHALTGLNRIDEALEVYSESIDLYIGEKKHDDAVAVAAAAADKLSLAGCLELSLGWYERTFEMVDEFGLEPDDKIAFAFHNYSVTLYNLHRTNEAIDAISRACDLRRKLFGDDDEMLVSDYLPMRDKMIKMASTVNNDDGEDPDQTQHMDVTTFSTLTDDESLIARFAKAQNFFSSGLMSHARTSFVNLLDDIDQECSPGAYAWVARSVAYAYEMENSVNADKSATEYYELALRSAVASESSGLLRDVAHDYAEYCWNKGDYDEAIRIYSFQLKGAAEVDGIYDISAVRCIGNIAIALLKSDVPDYNASLHLGTITMLLGYTLQHEEVSQWGENIVGQSLHELGISGDNYDVNLAESIFWSVSFMLDRDLYNGAYIMNRFYSSIPDGNWSDHDRLLQLIDKARLAKAFDEDSALEYAQAAFDYTSRHPDAVSDSAMNAIHELFAGIYMDCCRYDDAIAWYNRMQRHTDRTADKFIKAAFFTGSRRMAQAALDVVGGESFDLNGATVELTKLMRGEPADFGILDDGLQNDSSFDFICLILAHHRAGHDGVAFQYFRAIADYRYDDARYDLIRLYGIVYYLQEAGFADEAAIYLDEAKRRLGDAPDSSRQLFTKAFQVL